MGGQTMQIDGAMLQAMMENEKREKAQRYRILNRYARKGGIVFAGSSLMEQFPIYEFLLNDRLPYTIYNRGIGGATTEEFLRYMDVCVYELEPKAVFLNIGTNDLNDPACTSEHLAQQVEKVVKGIRERLSQTRIFLMAYYPVNPGAAEGPFLKEIFRSRTNQKIREANRLIHQMADRYGITFLNVNDVITDDEGKLVWEYTVEGMHMFANGYRRILEKLLPVLNSIEGWTDVKQLL